MAWNWQPVIQEQEAAGNWNWQPARVAEQTVLDDDTGQVYRAPVTFDEQDIRFAIATQVGKEPKRDFIGKVRYAAGEAWNWAEKFSDRVESGFQSAERGIVGLGGQALDTFLHASLSVPERTEQIEKYKSGDFSDWDASLNGRVTDEDIAGETDPALKAAMQFRKDRQDTLIARARNGWSSVNAFAVSLMQASESGRKFCGRKRKWTVTTGLWKRWAAVRRRWDCRSQRWRQPKIRRWRRGLWPAYSGGCAIRRFLTNP